MSDSSVKHTYYENMKGLIDPAFFVVTGFFGLEKLRSVEFINGPMTHQAMALAGAVNGLTIYLANRMGQAGENDSPYYKAMLTIVGLTAGALLTPYVVSKVLKSHAVLITPEMSFRIAAFNLVAKVAIYVTFTKAEQYYNAWNFPAFQNFDEMTEHTVRMLYDHFKDHADLWKKESFKKQLGFNQALLKCGLDPLSITDVDLEVSLTKGELETFRRQFEKGELTPEQASLLYNFHVPPQQNRAYKAENLPVIDPRKVKVENLSDEQIRWHHEWIIRNSSEVLHLSQIRAFVPHFYRLDLLPPSPSFVTELPLPKQLEGLSSAKVSYLAHYYLTNLHMWNDLPLKDQIVLKEAFAKHGLDNHPLREPTIDELRCSYVKKKHLKEFKKQFKDHEHQSWLIKSRSYQEGFNEVLSNQGMKILEIPEQPWSTTKKVVVFVVVPLAIIGIVTGVTWLALANRAEPINDNSTQDNKVPESCTGEDCLTSAQTPPTSSEKTSDDQIRDLSSGGESHKILLYTNTKPPEVISEVEHDENGERSSDIPTIVETDTLAQEVSKGDQTVINLADYVEGEAQCLLKEDVESVCTLADWFFEDLPTLPGEAHVVTLDRPAHIDKSAATDATQVGFPNLSVHELSFVDDREKQESIDSYERVYMTPDGIGPRELAPETSHREELIPTGGNPLSERSVVLEKQKVFDNSTLIFDKMCIDGYSNNGSTCLLPASQVKKDDSLGANPRAKEFQNLHSDETPTSPDSLALSGQENKLGDQESQGVVGPEIKDHKEGLQTGRTPSSDGDQRQNQLPLDSKQKVRDEASYFNWEWIFGGATILGVFLAAIQRLRTREKKEKKIVIPIYSDCIGKKETKQDSQHDTAVGERSPNPYEDKRKVISAGSLTPPPSRSNAVLSRSPIKPKTDPRGDRRKRINRSQVKPIPFVIPVESHASGSSEDHLGKKVDFSEQLAAITAIDKRNALSKGEQIAPVAAHIAIRAPEQKEIMRVASDGFEIPPINYVGVSVSRKGVDLSSYTQLVMEFADPKNDHELDSLEIDAALETAGEESVVKVLESESVLKLFEAVMVNDSLRMMKLRGFEKITVGELKTLKHKFPNVSCFDLDGIALEGDLDGTFKDCLVLHAEKGNRAAQEERFKTGIAERIEAFTTGTHTAFDDLFGSDPSQNPLGPMRLFAESVSFLRGLNISDGFIKSKIHPNLMKNFPNIRLLDLSNCSELTLESFQELVVIRVESLILEGCKKIFQRDSKTLASHNKVAHWWLTDPAALGKVAQCFLGIAPFVRFVNLYDTHEMDFMSAELVRELYQDEKEQGTRLADIKKAPDQTQHLQYRSYLVLENMIKIMQKTKSQQDGYRLELVQIGVKGQVDAMDVKVN